ncbi:class I SAM-dependent methyltransferase [Actinoplanes solisilvae]|uniref:class I SAM-dependent methyltransferase n=1 Tax=Actinoplanes solisilvae TaxID=2486853 RepID=UPI001F0BBA24|nr:class I SAM-dependent methyltransferase [Actinoplanes solisilvae]
MGRLRRLTRRQAILAAGACALCAAVAAAALTGNVGLALTLLAVFFTILFGGLLLVARRLAALQRTQRRHQDDVRTVLDQTQRRLLGALEELLLHSGDRHREMSDALAAQTGDVEALIQLYRAVEPRAPMPSTGSKTELLDVLHLIRTRKPSLVVELGGGASTVWTAYALEASGGKLVSLNRDAERTRERLEAHGLTEVVDLRAAVDDVTGIDLLVVYGEPELALTLVKGRLAAGALVVVGEAHRRTLETAEGLTREGEARYRRVVRQLSRSQ